jgi:hypothetical protein
MTSADVRDRLVHAIRLDLIGPEPEEPQCQLRAQLDSLVESGQVRRLAAF